MKRDACEALRSRPAGITRFQNFGPMGAKLQNATFYKTNGGMEVKGVNWFHITIRLTVLMQYAKGLQASDPETGSKVSAFLESSKRYLRHGNFVAALDWSILMTAACTAMTLSSTMKTENPCKNIWMRCIPTSGTIR